MIGVGICSFVGDALEGGTFGMVWRTPTARLARYPMAMASGKPYPVWPKHLSLAMSAETQVDEDSKVMEDSQVP